MWDIKEGFLEIMPELDLEEEEQVSHRKKSLGSGEDLPSRGNSMCKGTGASFSRESQWMVYEKFLRKAFPIAVQWPHRVCDKEFQSYPSGGGGAEEVQTLAKPACDLFLGVASVLFLSIPVGAIRKMKEAERTCLGVAVM